MRCLMCEEPNTMYIPSDDVEGVGLHSCGVCGFEIEAPRDRPALPVDQPREHAAIAAAATTTTTTVAKALQPL